MATYDTSMYCECCFKEDLDVFFEDQLGTIACSKKCCDEFDEYESPVKVQRTWEFHGEKTQSGE